MKLPASSALKVFYCLCLIATIFPMTNLGSTGWVALAVGGFFPGTSLIWLIFVVVRIYQVCRNREALDADSGLMSATFLRRVGLFSMGVGILASISIFIYRPIVGMLIKNTGENGIVFFVAGVGLYLLSLTGFLGLGLFEISRWMTKKENQTESALRK